MKDFVSKVTFGFLMAQLFPGAIAVLAIGFTYFTIETHQPHGLISTADEVLRRWGTSTTAQRLFLVGLCIAAGMFIHALQWAVLGSLQHRSSSGVVYDTPWYLRPLWKQILGGPWRIVRELGEFFVLTPNVSAASMHENVTEIDRNFMQQFDFIEEFYLATGQFFLHTAYALMSLMMAITTYICAYGPTWRRLALFGAAYLLTGLFFTLGRIQMCSLSDAEQTLVKRSRATHRRAATSTALSSLPAAVPLK